MMNNSKRLYQEGLLRNLDMLTQPQYPDYKFVGCVDRLKTFLIGIKALHFNSRAAFIIDEEGIKITVQNGKSIQASLFVTSQYFSEFHITESVEFGVHLNIISECLSIYSGYDCKAKMSYKGKGAPFVIELEPDVETEITTECAIKTFEFDELINYDIDENSSSLNQVFIRGPDFANIVKDLDKSAESFELILSPKEPYFQITTLGVMHLEMNVQVSKVSEMFLLFNCRDKTSARYHSEHIHSLPKFLTKCVKVALKTDANGLLEVHYLMHSDDEAKIYLQFYITPLVDLKT